MAQHSQRRTYSPLRPRISSPFISFIILPFLIFLASFPAPASAVGSAVIGIDVGTEYLKAALVKPGIPLEIVPTKDSKRKESAAVAFKPSRESEAAFPERFYGGDALALGARYPDDLYANLKTLLGVPFNGGQDDAVSTYQRRYPALTLESAGDRGTVGLRSNRLGEAEKKDPFMVEELLAMQLKQIKINADELAGKGTNIKDVVMTYPSFYTAEEKRSLELAAELAGLHIQAFVSDGLAVGLNYATTRTFPLVSAGQKPEYHVVYDMGAGSTTASVLRLQGRSIKDVGRFNKTVQEVHVLGTGWDKSLGGDALNDLIVDDMIANLVENKKLKDRVTAEEVQAHGKTKARLLKDAEKVRQVLSANTETGTSFESLYEEDLYFKYSVSRSTFEKLADNHASRVGGPVEQALAAAGLQLADIDSVILHGGAIRTPFVQKELEKLCGARKIRTSVNADEAAVFGAAFKGAALSPSFRVKDIRASDSSGYAVLLKWSSEGKDRQQKLFTSTSLVGPEKEVTVRNQDDFKFSFYQQLPVDEAMTESPVLDVQTQNLTASVAQLKDKFGCSASNITTKFSIRLSLVDGLPEVLGGSVSCEVDGGKKGIVDDVKGFFGLGSKKDGQAPLGEDGEPSESVNLESEESTTSTMSPSSETSTTTSAKETKTAAPQKKTEVIPIKITTSQLGVPAPSDAELKRIQNRLAAFDASDRDRIFRQEALNELESFIYRSRDLVEDEDFVRCLKPDQLSVLKQKAADASDWLYGDGTHAKTAEFQDKLKALKDIVNPALKRKQEGSTRPARVQALQDALKNAKTVIDLMKSTIQQDEDVYSSSMAESASSASASASATAATTETSTEAPTPSPETETDDPLEDLDEDPYSTISTSTSSTKPSTTPKPTGPKYTIFTPTDLTSLNNAYEPAATWLETQLAMQEKLGESDDPALEVSEIEARVRELERMLNRVYGKMGAGSRNSGGGNGKKSSGEKGKKKEGGKKDKDTTKKEKAPEKEKGKEKEKEEKPRKDEL